MSEHDVAAAIERLRDDDGSLDPDIALLVEENAELRAVVRANEERQRELAQVIQDRDRAYDALLEEHAQAMAEAVAEAVAPWMAATKALMRDGHFYDCLAGQRGRGDCSKVCRDLAALRASGSA